MKAMLLLPAFLLASFSLSGPGQAQDVGDRVPLKYAVEHQHKTGSCKGELTVDKWSFSYTSEDRPEDSRTWKVTEIKEVQSKASDELVLKTKESSAKRLGQDRPYRFNVLGAGIEKEVVEYMNRRVR